MSKRSVRKRRHRKKKGLRLYDPANVHVTVCGIEISQDYADGSFVSIERTK